MVSSVFAEDENASDVSRYQLKTMTDFVTKYRPGSEPTTLATHVSMTQDRYISPWPVHTQVADPHDRTVVE
jgi:hypothetical protein